MEVIIIIRKTVADRNEADILAGRVRTHVSNLPALNEPDAHVEIETRDKINLE